MKGFTLAEILVSTAILTLLFLGAFQILDAGTVSWFTGDTVSELRQEIVKAFMKMEIELKETRPSLISLSTGQTSSSLIFKLPTDTNGDGTVLDSSGNIEWSSNVTYSLNNSKQLIRTSSTGTTTIANNITHLQFSRPTSPNNILQIDITATKTSPTRRQIQDSDQIKIKMRN